MIDLTKTAPLDWRPAKIPKKSGGFRYLLIPNEELKELQNEILQELYRDKSLRPTVWATGFVPYRNIMTGARVHSTEASVVINIDVHNFFPTFPVEKVKEELLKSRSASDVAYILKYCVYTNKKGDQQCPQGAPTSPYLTNIGMRPLDRMIHAFADRRGFTYSRYADDITLAQDPENPMFNGDVKSYQNIIEGLKLLLGSYGLTISWKKVSVVHKNSPRAARRVTGVNIRNDGKGYNARPATRHKARSLVHILYKELESGKRPEDLIGLYREAMGTVNFCDYIRRQSDDKEARTPDPHTNRRKLKRIKEAFCGINISYNG